MVHTAQISLQTEGRTDVRDITDEVVQAVSRSGLRRGVVTLFSPSSTSALTTIEYEPGAVSDLKRALEEIAASDRDYAHNQTWDDGNGYAHLRAALLGPSLSVPFAESRLCLGTWQQIVFLDFDNRARRRTVMVQMIGE